jgi:hypothetical protein
MLISVTGRVKPISWNAFCSGWSPWCCVEVAHDEDSRPSHHAVVHTVPAWQACQADHIWSGHSRKVLTPSNLGTLINNISLMLAVTDIVRSTSLRALMFVEGLLLHYEHEEDCQCKGLQVTQYPNRPLCGPSHSRERFFVRLDQGTTTLPFTVAN